MNNLPSNYKIEMFQEPFGIRLMILYLLWEQKICQVHKIFQKHNVIVAMKNLNSLPKMQKNAIFVPNFIVKIVDLKQKLFQKIEIMNMVIFVLYVIVNFIFEKF